MYERFISDEILTYPVITWSAVPGMSNAHSIGLTGFCETNTGIYPGLSGAFWPVFKGSSGKSVFTCTMELLGG